MILLEESLLSRNGRDVTDMVLNRLKESVARDVSELLPHLEERCHQMADAAKAKLEERGEKEAKAMAKILEAQKQRIADTIAQFRDPQLSLEFDPEEKRQLEANRRHWNERLEAIDTELASEPDRIRDIYQVKASRIEPVGLVYLWPITG